MVEHNGGMEAVSDFAKIVKDNILRVLDESGVSKTELARRLEVPRPNISSLLNGDKEIQTDTIQRIADALGVKVAELVLEHEPATH